ncbi:gamma-glutamyl-gamma-aminobutyrate hydrolase family protein [Fictibacillus sp. KU28468]|uniref:gamma-glutamyl-gamma-aminobutyrate hydrolase family protein n=1 Tax=Fictibacillus sp. KU28468 TaxID=2991053 RepID=UPI00223CDAF6|nr:gamma-glutamyl-gamma-aminobutyrate hydrolase family protein [Fictibacillus sp. KU28468]UZJ77701.1 gamma-glutamyl-gamma-aminobutyrate hydrolase family protein [Fictibacillus sp. KU28468]
MENQKPVIGITCSTKDIGGQETAYLHYSYATSVMKAGGVPVILPMGDKETVKEWAALCDGILLSGGEDMDPQQIGAEPHPNLGKVIPERDETEINLINYAQNNNIPIFAICRGIQVLNGALGGTLVQDLNEEREDVIKHYQDGARSAATHSISVEKGTLLSEILGTEDISVNSFHHGAVDEVAPGLKAAAYASDGVIEALESTDLEKSWMLAVQWHPEDMTEVSDEMHQLFVHFVQKCHELLEKEQPAL